MRLINLTELTSEMRLAKPVYYQEQILLNTDCPNVYKYKNRLSDFGINHLYIDDELSEDIEIHDVIKEETRELGKKVLKDIFRETNISQRNAESIQKVVTDMVDEILYYDDIMVNLIDIKNFDSYTYFHSVNVTVLALIIGKSLQLTRERLIKLGTGALLHDIGKQLVPLEILNKPDQLTPDEYSLVQDHTRLGYEQLKEQYLISPLSKTVILSHHERVDGTGYPRGLKGSQIHEFARIVAIADVFDALNSDRIYRKKWPTHKILDYILAHVNTHFDQYFAKKFFRNMAIYPNGTKVILSTGEVAIVKEQNKNYPTLPIVRLVKGRGVINLLENHDIVIVDAES